MDAQVEVRSRSARGPTCVYCRDSIASGARSCVCNATYHPECLRELGRCATPGCARGAPGPASPGGPRPTAGGLPPLPAPPPRERPWEARPTGPPPRGRARPALPRIAQALLVVLAPGAVMLLLLALLLVVTFPSSGEPWTLGNVLRELRGMVGAMLPIFLFLSSPMLILALKLDAVEWEDEPTRS